MDRNSFYNNLANYSKNSLHSSGINLHDSSKIDFYNYIEHHGIKGQKWGVRRYQNPDGSLTEEGKQRYLNPDGSLTDKARKELKPDQQLKIRQEFYKKQSEEGTGEYADNAIYDENKQKEKLSNAKTKHMYDLDFVETIQNAENLSDDDINREYEAYLKNPRKYSEEFMVDGNGKITNSRSGVINAKPKTSDFTQDEKKKLLGDETPNKELKEKAKSAFGPKATPEEESKFWKALAAEYEKGNIKSSNSTKTSKEEKQKLTKEEKQEAKAAAKEVQKQLKGGLISNWALLNKAMKEAGITDQKNMTAADWNKVNEEIKKLRKK